MYLNIKRVPICLLFNLAVKVEMIKTDPLHEFIGFKQIKNL